MTPTTRHNLINAAIILLPTILAYAVYYLGGGNFERSVELGFVTLAGFVFSFIAAAYVTADGRGWK